MKFLSVIVPCYCDEETLEIFLTSLVSQSLPANLFEVIIVDDFSPVSLFDTFYNFKNKFSLSNIFLLQHEKNLGRSHARNSGIYKSKGDVLLFLDVDNVPEYNSLYELYKEFDESEFIVRCNVRSLRQHTSKSNYVNFFDSRYLGSRFNKSCSLDFRYFATDAVAMNRSILDKIGTFDVNFNLYGCEDEDLGIRASKLNLPFVFLHSALFYDNDYPCLKREAERMYIYAKHSMALLLIKHPSYSKISLFNQVEYAPSLFKKIRRYFYLFFLNKSIASLLMRILDFLDEKSISIPSFLYFYVIASNYVAGHKVRFIKEKE